MYMYTYLYDIVCIYTYPPWNTHDQHGAGSMRTTCRMNTTPILNMARDLPRASKQGP